MTDFASKVDTVINKALQLYTERAKFSSEVSAIGNLSIAFDKMSRKPDAVVNLARTLKLKNQAYGNSALSPLRLFSSLNAAAGIRVRIDDKLSRMRSTGMERDASEDTLLDLAGYFVLLAIAEGEV